MILSQTLQEAQDILSAIIVIAKSETEGSLPDETPTLSEKYKQKMKHILIESLSYEDIDSCDNNEINLAVSDENVWKMG